MDDSIRAGGRRRRMGMRGEERDKEPLLLLFMHLFIGGGRTGLPLLSLQINARVAGWGSAPGRVYLESGKTWGGPGWAGAVCFPPAGECFQESEPSKCDGACGTAASDPSFFFITFPRILVQLGSTQKAEAWRHASAGNSDASLLCSGALATSHGQPQALIRGARRTSRVRDIMGQTCTGHEQSPLLHAAPHAEESRLRLPCSESSKQYDNPTSKCNRYICNTSYYHPTNELLSALLQ